MTPNPPRRYVHDEHVTLPSYPRRLRAAARDASDADLRAAVDAALLLRLDTPMPDRDWTATPASRLRVLGHVAAIELAARAHHDLAREPTPRWLRATLGPRPDIGNPTARTVWRHAAGALAAVRRIYGIDHPTRAIGHGLPATQDPHGYATAALGRAGVAAVLARVSLEPTDHDPPAMPRRGADGSQGVHAASPSERPPADSR